MAGRVNGPALHRQRPSPVAVHGSPAKKMRFATLDAMRGVAALFVVARHFGDLRGAEARDQLSYLAVDFFFALSGFVLAHSYRDKLDDGRLAVRGFLVARVIRLWPLYLTGLAIPVVVAVHDGLGGFGGTVGFAKVVLRAIVLFPSNIGHEGVTIFPLNPPAWSLFFEFYVANLMFVLLPWQRSRTVLAVLVGGSAAALIVATIRYGTVDVGVTGGTIAGGTARVTFSFFLGVILERLRRHCSWPRRIPSLLPIIALATVLSVSLGGKASPYLELAAVLIVLPGLVFLGAGASERRPEIGEALGDASYAVYVLHFGLLELAGRALAFGGVYPGYGVETVFLLLVAALGWAADKYDRRIRRMLSRSVAGAGAGADGGRNAGWSTTRVKRSR